MIFIDADAFIALNVGPDFHHKKAVSLLAKLKKTEERLVTSWDVVDEVATKISYFSEKKTAVLFLSLVLKGEILVVFPDSKLARMARKVFQRQRSKRVSLTDCMNMVIAREKGIKMFFSFDKVYLKNGFELLR